MNRDNLRRVLIVMFLAACCCGTQVPILQAQDLNQPFGQPQYLIHLTGTSTADGYRPKDAYLLINVQPENGVWLSPDGYGGTFSNTVELLGGPFSTPAEVCQAASGLPPQTFNGWNHNTSFNCAAPAATETTRGVPPPPRLGATEEESPRSVAPVEEPGLRGWWNRQGTGTKVVVGGGVVIASILLMGWLLAGSVGTAIAAAAASSAAFAEEVVVAYTANKLTKQFTKRLAMQVGKSLAGKLGRKATEAEVKAAMLAAINHQLIARGLGSWSMQQFEVLVWGADLMFW